VNEILDRKIVFSTAWFKIIAKTLTGWAAPHYAVLARDYVTVLATTASGRVLLVRQFRPAVEEFTLELPAGHVDDGETPEEAARRELLEETGYAAKGLVLLASLAPDTGRLAMRQWCYFAAEAQPPTVGWVPEAGVEVIEWEVSELLDSIRKSKLNHALHIAVVFLWKLRTPATTLSSSATPGS
jgi:ADP-ribose pyrophosphatase